MGGGATLWGDAAAIGLTGFGVGSEFYGRRGCERVIALKLGVSGNLFVYYVYL